MDQDLDTRLRRYAASHHGLITRAALAELGASEAAVRHRVARGELEMLSPLVCRYLAAPKTVNQRVLSAVLDAGPGAVASHQTAASLWGLPGMFVQPIQVIGRRDHLHRGSAYLADVVHEPRLLLENHVMELAGVPLTSPGRTLIDLAGLSAVHTGRLARLLDTAWARNLINYHSINRTFRELAKRGRPGIRRMRTLLDERPADYRPPESGIEARLMALAATAMVGGLRRQVDIGDEDGWIGRMDFVSDSRLWIVEVDSGLFHGSLTDRSRDRARRERLRVTGWVVTEISDVELFHRTDHVTATLKEDHASARLRPERKVIA
jgi:very-short-patch-repair endonuclease